MNRNPKKKRLHELLDSLDRIHNELSNVNDEIVFDINHELRAIHARIEGLLMIKNDIPDLIYVAHMKQVNNDFGIIIEKLHVAYNNFDDD